MMRKTQRREVLPIARRRQRDVLCDVMLSARQCETWLTLDELAKLTHYPPASISAQLRHLRKPEYGGFVVEKRPRAVGKFLRGEDFGTIWEYQLKCAIRRKFVGARVRTHELPAYCALELILPDRSEVFSAQELAHGARPFLHHESAVLRLAQMPQLRGNACRRVMRQLGQFVQREPRFALPRAQHHVAKHVALPSSRDRQDFPSLSFSHHRLLSCRLSLLGRKLFCVRARRAVAILVFSIIRCGPRRAVRVFVIPRASAASAHLICPGSAVDGVNSGPRFGPSSSLVPLPPNFSTFFHNRLPYRNP